MFTEQERTLLVETVTTSTYPGKVSYVVLGIIEKLMTPEEYALYVEAQRQRYQALADALHTNDDETPDPVEDDDEPQTDDDVRPE